MSSESPTTGAARVAVVVTCFNSGDTLPETIRSILSCGTPVELVVVDDGSSDDRTREVLTELVSQGIQLIRQQNLGPSAATNAGTAATMAPYVMRFDSDDLLEPGALADLAGALDEAPDAAVAWGDFATFGRTTFVVPGALALDPWLVTHVNLTPGGGALIRRTALEATGGWRLSEGFEDWDLWMTFAEHAYLGIYVPRVVFRYRRRHSGRQALARRATARHYETLLGRHRQLVHNRRSNLRRSTVPMALKLLIPLIEAAPFVPRLTKINACELSARLLWSRSARDALQMLRQGLALRIREWRQTA